MVTISAGCRACTTAPVVFFLADIIIYYIYRCMREEINERAKTSVSAVHAVTDTRGCAKNEIISVLRINKYIIRVWHVQYIRKKPEKGVET